MRAIFWLVVCVAAFVAFVTHVAFGETGPVGWVNAAQAALFGGYSRRVSAMVLMAVVGIPVVTIWALVAPSSLRRNAQKAGAVMDTPIKRGAMTKTALAGWTFLAWVVCVALVWAAVVGYAGWQQHIHNQDESAAYFPLELTPGMNDAAGGREHLALRGQILGDYVVSRKKGNDGSEAMMLVPVVERGWHEGDPVHFVMRFGAQGENALRKSLQQPSESSLHVRTDGSVPTLARQVFERMRAPLADDAVALVLVPAQSTDPVVASSEAGASDVLQSGAIGTALVTALFAMIVAAMVGSARQARKRAATASR